MLIFYIYMILSHSSGLSLKITTSDGGLPQLLSKNIFTQVSSKYSLKSSSLCVLPYKYKLYFTPSAYYHAQHILDGVVSSQGQGDI